MTNSLLTTKQQNIFDLDIFYLANHFDIPQLRREIHNAEINAKVDAIWHGTEYADTHPFPWLYFADCCREAIEWIQAKKPVSQPIPGRFIDTVAIKAKNDIVAVIERYTGLKKTGRNFKGRCPIHADKTPSMTVYTDSQSWHCFGCNQGGDIFDFVQAVENTDFRGAAAVLGGNL